jgi:phosphate transport system permease protein
LQDDSVSLRKQYTVARFQEQVIETALLLCALVSIITTVGIIFVLVTESVFSVSGEKAFFQVVSPLEFFFGTQWSPQFADKHFGVLPLLCGTVLVAGIAALTGLPAGMLAAIYLSEYATPALRRVVKPFLEILAGIPTVVYGYFALEFITPFVLKPIFQSALGWDIDGFNALSGGLVVGIMIIPMVCSLSEDALRAVPRSLREAGYALGSTKYDVCVKVVVPAATSGIIASFLLALSRAIGETMAVVIACGQSPVLTLNPLRSIQTMTSFMVNISLGDTPAGSIEYKSLYAVGLTLFCMTLAMNVLSQHVMHRFREVYH